MHVRRALFAGAMMLLNFGAAHGADVPGGLKAARTLCVNCHIVEADAVGQKPMTAGIPTFMAIAEKPGQTQDKLKAYMLNPHPPMPQVQLTTHELDNLSAYILSLKGKP